jgi:hypothetical protein
MNANQASASTSGTDLLADIDPAEFWDDSTAAARSYVSPAPDEGVIAQVQAELGYRLPRSYISMMRRHNGGLLRRSCASANSRTTWADDHVAINGIFGIDRRLEHSLCGATGSQFWIDEWGYPALGVYFADCPSAGHDMIALDYRGCGRDGEPQVVHVDQEWDYKITVLAENFAQFVRSLRAEEDFEL